MFNQYHDLYVLQIKVSCSLDQNICHDSTDSTDPLIFSIQLFFFIDYETIYAYSFSRGFSIILRIPNIDKFRNHITKIF